MARKRQAYTVEQIAKWALCSEESVRDAIRALKIPYSGRRQVMVSGNGLVCASRDRLNERDVHSILRKLYSNRREKVLPFWRRAMDARLAFSLTLDQMSLKERRMLFKRLEQTCCKPPEEDA